eukprot:CAMPEP_0197830370 /NCGR_PEP_ID=MMETSP1437-20131217/6983_1 /TAXON_ID=49252 ORGANISM="Eucampia antarctica, Strain CCMP1452" /NCGR_SAMPLE_ID=MMETSP1437 /ASSEMBLY_ACC=CAM_ASM_001096 /LENGTH=572 /DNA_ID=CAMNT_0043432731 /DNA_START=1 /DNA_END=1719 /DNA_ORIENTATION=+
MFSEDGQILGIKSPDKMDGLSETNQVASEAVSDVPVDSKEETAEKVESTKEDGGRVGVEIETTKTGAGTAIGTSEEKLETVKEEIKTVGKKVESNKMKASAKLNSGKATPQTSSPHRTPNRKDSSIVEIAEPEEDSRIKLLNGLDYLDDLLNNIAIDPGDDDLLKWSSDAPHHLSDYCIEVKDQKDGSKNKYYVHKLVLSTGPTKCGLFEQIFTESKNNSDGKTINLSHSAAKVFPELLDFLYSREDRLDLTSDNAVTLRHLGKLLVIKKLVMKVTLFIRDDLKAHLSLRYLNSAFEFMDENLIDNAAKVCAANITVVDRDGLTNLDPYLFSKVVSCDKISCSSEELSKIVSEFCRKHNTEMSTDLLRVITDSKNMPVVDHSECVYLLHLSEKYSTDAGGKTDLGERVLLSGSESWNRTIVRELKVEQDAVGPYDELSAELKVKLLEDSLIRASKDYNRVLRNQDKTVEGIKAEANKSFRLKETSLDAALRNAKQLKSENLNLKKELHSFKRLPANYKFPKNRNQYSYDPSGDSKYGQDRPTTQPSTVGPEADAGIVIVEGQHVFPVYSYQP